MLDASLFILPRELWTWVGTADAPQIVDVRPRKAYAASPAMLPAALWRESKNVADWTGELDRSRSVVVACSAGGEHSQIVAADLHRQGFNATVLAGGLHGWIHAGLPVVDRTAFEYFAPRQPSAWVTRQRPKIDRVACPWLIRRFLDPQAGILFVKTPDVPALARASGAIPFDVDGVELTHEGERCSFDTMLKCFGLESEPSLARLAIIVRGADTARMDLAPEAAGLLAVSLGLSALAADDDYTMLRQGFIVYDALYTWLRFAAGERHHWPVKAT